MPRTVTRDGAAPQRIVTVLMLCAAALLAGACNRIFTRLEGPQGLDGQTSFEASVLDAGPLEASVDPLTLVRLDPDQGSYRGGNNVVLRGTGLSKNLTVLVGTQTVDAETFVEIDSRRLQFTMPPGDPGSVDLVVRSPAGEKRLLAAYAYQAVDLSPVRGSTAGGTYVVIEAQSEAALGFSFEPGMSVLFGFQDCLDIQVISTTKLSCRTPPGDLGPVDVTIRKGISAEYRMAAAYSYTDSTNADVGGLRGVFQGELEVRVMNSVTGTPIPTAQVIVGDAATSPYRGQADGDGRVVFSGPDLRPPFHVHISRDCFESASFVSFDAASVTAFLVPHRDLRCIDITMLPPNGPGSSSGSGRSGAFVRGVLRWPGGEFGQDPFSGLPPSTEQNERVAYVFATQSGVDTFNPDPANGGAKPRVVESDATGGSVPYEIFVLPGSFAVVAVAGLEDRITKRFVAYQMGIARGVAVAPAEAREGIDVSLNMALDRSVEISPPALISQNTSLATRPDRFRARAVLGLGADGYVVRRINQNLLDQQSGLIPSSPLRMIGYPNVVSSIASSRLFYEYGWYTGDGFGAPCSWVRSEGSYAGDQTRTFDGLLSVAEISSPPNSGIWSSRTFAADFPAPYKPTFYVIRLAGSDGFSAWRMFVRGDVRTFELPDFSTLPNGREIPAGRVTATVSAIRLRSGTFDEFGYDSLNERNWVASSQTTFTFVR